MEGRSGLTRSIIDQVQSPYMQQDQTEGESAVTRSNIDELHF